MTIDPNIDKIGELAVEISGKSGVTYADCRMVQVTEEKVEVHTGAIDALSRSESWGIGVRVLYNGYWGFASSADVTPETAAALRDRAIEIAQASARLSGEPATLAPVKVVQDEFRTKITTDPFTIPLKEKLQYVKHLDSLLRADEALNQTVAGLDFRREMRHFYSSEGSRIHQEIYQSGAGISAGITSGHRASFTRSYPTSSGQYESAGYELVAKLKLEDAVGPLIEETKAVAAAEDCPSFTGTLILAGDLMSLQIHESIGHPLELDRVYGSERNFSGTSFATPDLLGKLKYGSDIVTVFTDPTVPGALASFGYDDEGVPAVRSPLIEKGVLVGYLTSRETAARIGTTSDASMRARDWSFLPLIRMTNTILEPGDKTLDDMIAETDNGIYIQTPSSWSIDDRRENFQLGGEYARLIKGGQLTDVVKNPVYSGNTVQFWNSCDAIGTRDEYRVWGTPACGKGQPGQTIATAQGSAPARFQNVKIGP
jgi:TldD protein